METEIKNMIAFRLDGGSKNMQDPGNKRGMGHISRCMVIADLCRSKGYGSFFIMRDYPAGTSKVSERYPVVVIPETFNDEQELIYLAEILEKKNPSVLVLDVLNTEEFFIKNLKKVGIKIVTIDNEKAHPELVNAAIFSLVRQPKSFIPFANSYGGPQYQVVSQVFLDYKEKAKKIPPKAKKILVSLGGSDPTNSTFKVSEALSEIKLELDVKLVLGPAFASNWEFDSFSQHLKKGFVVVKNIKNMAEEIFAADLMIGSGGISVYEAAVLGTPSIILCHNEHELNNVFNDYGIALNLGLAEKVAKEDLKNSVIRLISDSNLRKELSLKGRELIDGQGASRIAKIILDLAKKEQKDVL